MGKMSTINKHGKSDIRLRIESVLNDGSEYIFCFCLTILNQNDWSISVLVQNEVELELRVRRMDFVHFDKRRVSGLN